MGCEEIRRVFRLVISAATDNFVMCFVEMRAIGGRHTFTSFLKLALWHEEQVNMGNFQLPPVARGVALGLFLCLKPTVYSQNICRGAAWNSRVLILSVSFWMMFCF
jgi:hypothetical protein